MPAGGRPVRHTSTEPEQPVSTITACQNCGTKNRVPESVTGRPRCAQCKADLPWLIDAIDDNFDDATDSTLPVLVDLWAPWCGPCRMVAPGVESAAREFAGKLKVVKVNVDDAPEVSRRFGVQSIPMLLVLRDGKLIDGHIGAMAPDQLLSWVTEHAGS